MGVRSTNLGAYQRGPATSSGLVTIYTVSSGHTAILKELAISNGTGTTSSVVVFVTPVAGVTLVIYNNTALPANSVVHIDMWTVIEAGGTIQVVVTGQGGGSATTVVCSGANLEGQD